MKKLLKICFELCFDLNNPTFTYTKISKSCKIKTGTI